MPLSNNVRCSGRLMLEISRCKSWILAGSTWTSERERKSACFWLSPSKATASPGSRSVSSAWTMAPVSRTCPFIHAAIRARRAAFFALRRDQGAVWPAD